MHTGLCRVCVSSGEDRGRLKEYLIEKGRGGKESQDFNDANSGMS